MIKERIKAEQDERLYRYLGMKKEKVEDILFPLILEAYEESKKYETGLGYLECTGVYATWINRIRNREYLYGARVVYPYAKDSLRRLKKLGDVSKKKDKGIKPLVKMLEILIDEEEQEWQTYLTKSHIQ